jgi:hypothetical protein
VTVATLIRAAESGNAPLEGVLVVTEVVAPGGLVVFSETASIDLAPGSEVNLFAIWNTGTRRTSEAPPACWLPPARPASSRARPARASPTAAPPAA